MHDRGHWHASYHPSLEALLEWMSQFTLKRPSRCQKMLKQRENGRHWAQYMGLKELFKLELNRSLNTWLQDNFKNLKTSGPDFWKKYQRFFVDRNKTLLGALKNYEEKLVSSEEERMEVLKRSFFTGEHLLSQNFTETNRLQAAITKTRLLSKDALDEKMFSQRIRYTPWNRNQSSAMCIIMLGEKTHTRMMCLLIYAFIVFCCNWHMFYLRCRCPFDMCFGIFEQCFVIRSFYWGFHFSRSEDRKRLLVE